MGNINIRMPTRYLLTVFVINAVFAVCNTARADIEFNSDLLDLDDKENIDLNKFSKSGYIMPGSYPLRLMVNNRSINEKLNINYYSQPDDPDSSLPCITSRIVELAGLKEEYERKISWNNESGEQCANPDSLPGTTAEGDLSNSRFELTIPTDYLEYTSDNWEPVSRWDDGISGILFDYSANARYNRSVKNDSNSVVMNGNGVSGINLGPWRLRGDWQARADYADGAKINSNKFSWTRLYAYRALKSLKAKLTLGEDYLRSDLFSSFRYIGINVNSDITMLPPNLRGYSPEITGVAETNATVIVSQNDRVLYQTQVPAGPFSVQGLSEGVTGPVQVRIEEQDGRVQTFEINATSVPYLTRPGQVRYKLSTGRPANQDHKTEGKIFVTGEFSWGIANGWSLFGGSILSEDYRSAAVGVGRDLHKFGALSVDITRAVAMVSAINNENETMKGMRVHLNYTKRMEEINSQFQFSAYRYTEKDFLDMNDVIDWNPFRHNQANNKGMYTLTFSKTFPEQGITSSVNFSERTYWNKQRTQNYNASVYKNLDIGKVKNISLSMSAYRSNYENKHDNGVYFNISLPIGNSSTLSYSLTADDDNVVNKASYYHRIDSNTSYQLGTGLAKSGAAVDGYISHIGNDAKVTASTNYMHNKNASVGMSIQGGMTLTPEGGDIHRIATVGSSRLLIDTNGVKDIPIRSTGAVTQTNAFGKAIIPEISSYYKNSVRVDLKKLPEDAEIVDSIVQASLTEGAIGYRTFDILSGKKMMAVIRLANGKYPPFGAIVKNHQDQETGIVIENGFVYLSGIKPNEYMVITWDGNRCDIQLPSELSDVSENSLLLTCIENNDAE